MERTIGILRNKLEDVIEAAERNEELERVAVDMFAGYNVRAVVNNTRQELFDLLIARGLLVVDENDTIQRA